MTMTKTYHYEFKVTFQQPGRASDFTLVVAPNTAAAEAMARGRGLNVLGVGLLGAVGYRYATECGEWWESLPHACPRCNPNGEHYHFANGECDTEPCMRHGGPQ